jgi:hypothetical protein
MKKNLFYAVLASVLYAVPAAAQLTVTAPAGQINVKAADDFATRAFQDPWDMSQRTDVGWWLFGNDFPPSNWTNPTFANGLFSGTTAGAGARLFMLESGLQPTPGGQASPIGKTGQQYPIDANKYTHLLYRMSSPTGFQDTGDPNNVSQFIWSTNTIYDDQTLGVNKQVIRDMAIYDVDLTQLQAVAQIGPVSPWSGTKRSFQFLPNNKTGVLLQLDWVRLVDGSDPTLFKTITWTGAGAVDIYLDNDSVASNGNLGRIAINTSAHTFTFFIGGLDPGDYYVAVAPHADAASTGAGLVYSSGFYRVNAIPMLTFTTPSDEGGSDDFATTKLGNPWDFTSLTDIDFKSNINNDSITQLTLTTEAGVNLGPQTVYQGTSAPGTSASGGVGDPFLYPLFWNGRGKITQIDPSRYRILTIEAGIPNQPRSLLNGSIGRVVWRAVNEQTRGTDGLPGQTVSEHYEFNHAAGENTISKTVVDMKYMPIEPGSVGKSSWLSTTSLGGLDAFRFDPHEFTNPTQFYLRRIKLAALERSVSNQLTFRWTYSKPSGMVSLFRETSGAPKAFAGIQIVLNVDATLGSYTWDVTAVPDGEYQIYAVFTDGTNSNQVYAPTPIVVDHSNVLVQQINLNRTQLNFATLGPTRTPAQTVRLTFAGSGSTCWTSTSTLGSLIAVTPASGTGAAALSIGLAPGSNFPGGTTSGIITIQSCSNPSNSRAIAISVTAYTSTSGPSGSMDTPVDGSAASGSVAVTGWAADDIGVASVAICRDPVGAETTTPGQCGGQPRVFIGNPVFIDDARSDIAAANPTTPLNYRAGWGYLMLTNFLPNQGNGSFTLYAFATDLEGHVALLGSKTIIGQNATSIKPFGAIDRPTQGEVVCGSSYINFGWALTQRPKDVPADSSTISVFIDNLFVGRPGARLQRSDITGAFPTLDTTHAVGGYIFDTTQYANGVHTIFWIVTDTTGQQDGVGSRFFTVSNPCGS